MTRNIKQNKSPVSENISWTKGLVSSDVRANVAGQRGCVVWLTGLSGSGKSSIAKQLEKYLIADDHLCYVLDGDNIRHGLNCDLGFSPEDRTENIRRISEVAALFADAGIITLVAFISPYRQGRSHARAAVGEEKFIEVFCDTPLEVCRQRDTKGLYKKAEAGELQNFTGINAPYEAPENPDIVIKTQKQTLEVSTAIVMDYLKDKGFLVFER